MYGEEYYKGGNYTDYLSRRQRYWQLASDIDHFLDSMCLRNVEGRLLDYGSGPGFLVEGFSKLGYTQSIGFDISTWSSEYAAEEGVARVTNDADVLDSEYDLVTMLDVLEHIEQGECCKLLLKIEADHMIVRIPVCEADGGDYVLPVSNRDPTHITKLTKESWTSIFRQAGYAQVCRINLPNIWDSDGVMCAMFRREDV